MRPQIVTITQQELNKQLGVQGHTNPGMISRWAESVMADIEAEEKAAADRLVERVAEAHRDANSLITWLSIPGVGQRYNLEAAYLITMLKMCMNSTSPGESVNDIDLLVEYIKGAVS